MVQGRKGRVRKTVPISAEDFRILEQAGQGNIETGLHVILAYWSKDVQRQVEQAAADRASTTPEARLLAGAGSGDLIKVQQAVVEGASVQATNETGDTALHRASSSGQLTVAEWLLDQHASANALNDKKRSSLWWAAWGGHIDVVSLLLTHGADSNLSDVEAWTPLMAALMKNQLDVVQKLKPITTWYGKYLQTIYYRYPLAPPSHTPPGEDALFWEMAQNKLDWMSFDNIHANARVEPHVRGRLSTNPFNEGDTLLIVAAHYGQIENARLLLEKSADPNQENAKKATALHHAAHEGRADIVDLLLKHPNIQCLKEDLFGFRASHVAEQKGHLAIRDQLHKAEAHEQARNLESLLPAAITRSGSQRL